MLTNESGGGSNQAPFGKNKKASTYLNPNAKLSGLISFKNKNSQGTRNNKD